MQDDLKLAESALLLAGGDARAAAEIALSLDREHSWGGKLDIKSRHALPGALGERHTADTAEVAS